VKATLAYARASLVELMRVPAFSVSTLLFPTLTYLFVTSTVYAETDPAVAMAGVAGTAVLGVSFFQFGVGIANERRTPWERYLRTLPVSIRARMAGRVLAALPFASAAAMLVVLTAIARDGVALSAERWILLSIGLVAGGIPFALAGIALGYWLSPRAAIPVANLVFLGAALAGGLWAGPAHLPEAAESYSSIVPTRRWGELLWASVEGRPWRMVDVALLAAFGLAFGLAAAWGYRRDQGELFT
jgi:ABC-2 type transport system permease protein